MKKAILNYLMLALIIGSLSTSCTVMSNYQSAKTIGKGSVEGTASFTNYGHTDEFSRAYDDDAFKYNSIGVQGAYGVTDKFDAGLRYELVLSEDVKVSHFALSGKYNLLENILSAYVPIGMYFGEDLDVGETFHARPTLIGNVDISDNIELSPYLGYALSFNSEFNNYLQIGISSGINFGSMDALTIRPELGFSFNGEDAGKQRIINAGLGVLYRLK
jgi:hypothetical protein